MCPRPRVLLSPCINPGQKKTLANFQAESEESRNGREVTSGDGGGLLVDLIGFFFDVAGLSYVMILMYRDRRQDIAQEMEGN